jgi:WD40 repeat protein
MKLGVSSIQAEEQKPLAHSNEEGAVHVAHSIARQERGSIVVSTTTYGANAIYSWHTENNRSAVIDTRKSAIGALDVGRNLIAVGDFGGKVGLYAIGSAAKVDEFSMQAPIETVVLDPEDSVLFASSADGEIAVCQIVASSSPSWLARFRLMFNLTGSEPFQSVATENHVISCKHRAGEQRVLRAVFSAQQRLIGATKMGVFIARPETGWAFEVLSDDGEAQSLAADEQTSNIAAAIGGVLKVWDADTLELHASIRVPNPIQRIRFIPDKGRRIATLDGTTLRVWDWSRRALLADACARWSPYHRIAPAPVLISMPDRAQLCGPPTRGSLQRNRRS